MQLITPSITREQTDPDALRELIRKSVPEPIIRNHPGIVETMMCVILIQQGCDDSMLSNHTPGCRRDQVAAQINRVLLDTPASVWLFSMLDLHQRRTSVTQPLPREKNPATAAP